jgi:hypothetical protein
MIRSDAGDLGVLASANTDIEVRHMNKRRPSNKPRTLELNKQTIVHLTDELLRNVVGGNNSTRPSQCVTLCF